VHKFSKRYTVAALKYHLQQVGDSMRTLSTVPAPYSLSPTSVILN